MVRNLTRNDSGVAKLVERQMRNWELARSQKSTIEAAESRGVADFICVSREVAAGGSQVAALVGERLGWPVFDKELLHAMAKDDAVRRLIYANMDERDLGWCEGTVRSFMEPGFARNDYFHRLTETVLVLARQGSAVFVGRGIDMILPAQRGLRVRIVAPMVQRIERLATERGLSLEYARRELLRLEAERARFIREHFHAEVGAAERYDLVINTGRLEPEQAADLILWTRARLQMDPAAAPWRPSEQPAPGHPPFSKGRGGGVRLHAGPRIRPPPQDGVGHPCNPGSRVRVER
jgi:cytidylate kinase